MNKFSKTIIFNILCWVLLVIFDIIQEYNQLGLGIMIAPMLIASVGMTFLYILQRKKDIQKNEFVFKESVAFLVIWMALSFLIDGYIMYRMEQNRWFIIQGSGYMDGIEYAIFGGAIGIPALIILIIELFKNISEGRKGL